MVSLTIQQRNLLNLLLNADSPVTLADLAEMTNLSARQVRYRLKPVKSWLAQHEVILKTTPGVGLSVECPLDQRQQLLRQLNTQSDFQLVLTAGQRQQLFALNLLTSNEPMILNWLQHAAAVSRTTVLKDLEPIEAWIKMFGLALIRKPGYGIEIEGSELSRRQAMIALLWGEVPFENPMMTVNYGGSLVFSLAGKGSLAIIKQASQFLNRLNIYAALDWVAYAEAQLDGRFNDNAVLHLALVFAIQARRVRDNHCLELDSATLDWLHGRRVWLVATDVAETMWPDMQLESLSSEIGSMAMHLLGGTRDHLWPGDLEIDSILTTLIDVLMAEVAMAYATPGLRHDMALRDGFVAHIIPAYMRERFGLWAPPSWADSALPSRYRREYEIARELAQIVTERSGVILPDGEIKNLALLLRAAFIRESSSRPKRVFVICPSGMATAQLLLARLKARFPGMDILGVLSVRQLSFERIAGAHLLISTVPVSVPPKGPHVIQVHPLLLSEDIEKITQWLASP